MPSVDDILAGRVRLLDTAPASFVEEVEAVAARLARALDAILAEYDREGGKLAASERNVTAAANALPALAQALEDAGYAAAVDRFIDRYADVAERVARTFEVQRLPAAFSARSVEALEVAREVDMEWLQRLGTRAVEEVQLSIRQGLLAERDYTSFVEDLRRAIVGTDQRGAPLARYAGTYASTAIGQFDRLVTARLGDDSGVEYWRYWGPLDRITRPWCRRLLNDNRPRTRDEIEALPRSESNTTGESAFIAGGGWRCRHLFVAVPSDELEQQ